jgi:hypothetical protein
VNPKHKKRKQIESGGHRRITPLKIVGWGVLAAFVGLAVFLTVDLVRSRGGGDQQSAVAPATTPVTTSATGSAEQYTGGARLYLPATEVDLGQVPLMTNVSHSFDLQNVGDAPLVISEPSVKILEGC